MTHLNNVGFRKYAIEFINFIEVEIFGEIGGYDKYKENPSFLTDKDPPLKKLVKYRAFNEWFWYGDRVDKSILYKNCITDDPEDFEDSIFFSTSSEI